MNDAALHFGDIAEKESKIIDQLQIKPGQYILSTIHRQENTDNPKKLKNIIFDYFCKFYSISNIGQI